MARQWLRFGLVFLTVTQVAVGLWTLLFPSSFFAIPVVNLGMAYNPHLMMDYGALSLATAVVLAMAAMDMSARLVRAGLLVYLTFSVLHFGLHATMVGQLSAGTTAALLIVLAVVALIPLALLVLANRVTQPS